MSSRSIPSVIVVVALALALMAAGYGLGRQSAPSTAQAAQEGPATWNSTMIWRPTLEEAGLALAEWVNQIEASCNVDVDTVTAINGSGPEGDVYAFAVTWAC